MSLLDQIRSIVTIDVDSMDPADAKRHTTDTVKFADMTSNQAIVFGNATPAVLQRAVDYAKSKSGGGGVTVERVVDVLVSPLAFSGPLPSTNNITVPRLFYWRKMSCRISAETSTLRPRRVSGIV